MNEHQTLVMTAEHYAVVGTKDITLTMNQGAEAYDALPGSEEANGDWECYRPGKRSWDIAHSGLYAREMDAGYNDGMVTGDDVFFMAYVQVAAKVRLQGFVHVEDVQIDAPHDGLALYRAKVIGDDFPTIKKE